MVNLQAKVGRCNPLRARRRPAFLAGGIDPAKLQRGRLDRRAGPGPGHHAGDGWGPGYAWPIDANQGDRGRLAEDRSPGRGELHRGRSAATVGRWAGRKAGGPGRRLDHRAGWTCSAALWRLTKKWKSGLAFPGSRTIMILDGRIIIDRKG